MKTPLVNAWKTIIRQLGYDAKDPHLKDSPMRVARFLEEWHTQSGEPPVLTIFPNNPRVDEMVAVGGLQFYSLCAHHGVPFFGTAAIGYIPRDGVLGLSKFARTVDYFANRFQTQEILTHQIATFLSNRLKPRGLGVVLRAEHLCMSMRGIRKPGHHTVTSVMFGLCKEDASARAELLTLVRADT